MKSFKKVLALLLASIMVFMSACESEEATKELEEGESADFLSYYTSEIGTLNFLVTNKSVDADAIAKFCDPLVLVDKFGAFEPGMATSWEQSEDGKVWTFNIREGIYWQRWDGTKYEEITAQDWVDAIEYILDPNLASFTVDFVLDYIEGARDYYEGKVDFDKVGVKAIDSHTLEYTTVDVVPFFASLVTYSCYLPISKQFVEEEIGGIDNFGNSKENFLYYGEFLFDNWVLDQEWIFVKNPDYYLEHRVHINRAEYIMIQDTKVALEMYKRGEISSAPIVSDQVDAAFADPNLADYVYMTDLSAASWYYLFNTADNNPNRNFVEAVKNLNFRKAIFHAFDRITMLSASNKFEPEALKRNTLNVWGLSIDENGKDYMTHGKLQEIENRDPLDKDAAKDYLDKAKEELGSKVTWPVKIVLNSTNTETNVLVASIFKQMLEGTLGKENIEVEFNLFPSAQYYEKQEEGLFDMTSTGWIPDFADPSAYLEINMLQGYIGGRYGFENIDEWVEFDDMMRDAKAITDSLSDRYDALAEAEAYIIDQALVIPYRGSGGNYAINNLQNPYDSLARIPYGLCNSMFKDLIYGTSPLSAADREAQREAYYKEAANR